MAVAEIRQRVPANPRQRPCRYVRPAATPNLQSLIMLLRFLSACL